METIYETSQKTGNAHITLVKYKNANNISHYHSDHELVYVHQGNAWVTVNETTFPLQRGMCAFIHSNDIHTIRSNADTVLSVIKADCDYFGNIFSSKRLTSPIPKGRYAMEPFLEEIAAELKNHAEYSDVIIDCTAAKFFAHMLRSEDTYQQISAPTDRPSANEIYRGISQKIFNEYSTITFSEAARYMHFSKPYFSKVFHQLFGMTFTHYLNTVKVSFAIEKIKKGDMSITEVSASCGFNTIRNFNRVFKEFTGYSPNALPQNYVFIYHLRDATGLDPTLNCTEILE